MMNLLDNTSGVMTNNSPPRSTHRFRLSLRSAPDLQLRTTHKPSHEWCEIPSFQVRRLNSRRDNDENDRSTNAKHFGLSSASGVLEFRNKYRRVFRVSNAQ